MYTTTRETGIFQKDSRPLNKAALHNLYEEDLDERKANKKFDAHVFPSFYLKIKQNKIIEIARARYRISNKIYKEFHVFTEML